MGFGEDFGYKETFVKLKMLLEVTYKLKNLVFKNYQTLTIPRIKSVFVFNIVKERCIHCSG